MAHLFIGSYTILTLQLLLFENVIFIKGQDCSSQHMSLCNYLTTNNCDGCLQINPCCSWCYQIDFNKTRCSLYDKLIDNGCDQSFIENNTFIKKEIVNREFEDVRDERASRVLQFKPQEINIGLRKGISTEVEIQFKLAKNYPLDIYYLMDLSRSMLDVLNKFIELGEEITNQLGDITKYFKTGFGAFIDKTRLPFYPTAPERFNNPCGLVNSGDTCSKGYVYKHVSNFTNITSEFLELMKVQNISGNLDSLEGGLIAIHQLLICDTINWRENSRKLILLVTDSDLHMAGDGLLSGTVKRNNNTCLLDNKGNYDEQFYDYPSLSEIRTHLLRQKTNLIIVTKNKMVEYYKKLKAVIHEVTFLGELEENNTNILNLIREGYESFTRRAKFRIYRTEPQIPNIKEYLDVKIFTDCNDNREYWESDSCVGVSEGNIVKLKLKVTLLKPLKLQHDKITLYLEEKGVHEKVKLNLNVVTCKCENTQIAVDCVHGRSKCNACKCDEKWAGELCEKECSDQKSLCINGTFFACSGNGKCVCGKCECDFSYVGEFCEFQCPYTKEGLCNNHGQCDKGKCLCEETYFGEGCENTNRTKFCTLPGRGDVICNDHGKCVNDKCECDDGYNGIYCENCGNCEGLCDTYVDCVFDAVIENKLDCVLDNQTIQVSVLENEDSIKKIQSAYCFRRKANGTSICEASYTYYNVKSKGTVLYTVGSCKKATEQASTSLILLIFLGVVIIGAILVIAIWKITNYYKDTIEYKKFSREVNKSANNQNVNPIYNSPIRSYENPMRKED